MPRDIPVGNGSPLVNFDDKYNLRDLYWPHVGSENHTSGRACRFGVWVDNHFSWVSSDGWIRRLEYVDHTLVTQVSLEHKELALRLVCQDVVDFHENLYLRRITVHNDTNQSREVRLFFSHDLNISVNTIGDTAYYEPERQAVYHYKGQRWFMINMGRRENDEWHLGIDQWAVGVKDRDGYEGTWRDAEDGKLSGNSIVQGSVDSVVALHLTVPSQGDAEGWYWIAVADSFKAVTAINRAIRNKGPYEFLKRTANYWMLWLKQDSKNFKDLSDAIRNQYLRSLLIIRTQIDHDGAILAANDFDASTFSHDTYSYMWPRDGAMVSSALTGAGYYEVAYKFFEFCHRAIMPEGYLLHKYGPDGSLASSWHGWYNNGKKVLPIQEDETALVVWAVWRHFNQFHEVEFIKPYYRGLVIRAANWMADYRDLASGLPLPSWDLWEERYGVSAWTVGATWGGLQAGAHLAEAFGEYQLAEKYRQAAEEIRAGTEALLWKAEINRFARMIVQCDGGWDVDQTVDASLVGLWYFGMFAPDDPRIVATMQQIQEQLWVPTEVGGLARYENDNYYRDSSPNIPGNPWFICTLWLAQWYIATAHTLDALKPALDILQWTTDHALPSRVLAEQLHPQSSAPLSVSPLTWSHAAFVTSVREYLTKRAEILKE